MGQPITLESEGVPIEVQECRKRGQLVCFQRRVDAWVTHVDIVSPFGPGGIHSAAHCRLPKSLARYEKDGDRATLDLAEGHEVFSRQVDVVVVALSWRRTVVVEQGRWRSRRTAWKPPHGATVRNLRAVQKLEPDIEIEAGMRRAGASMPASKSHEVLAKHTIFEYEEFEWRKFRTFSAKGDGPADVAWPEHTLEADQRITERRETYHATFAVKGDDGDEYLTELDEATWRRLRIGRRCRLKIGALGDEVKQVTPL